MTARVRAAIDLKNNGATLPIGNRTLKPEKCPHRGAGPCPNLQIIDAVQLWPNALG
jgi:hypothetical protein